MSIVVDASICVAWAIADERTEAVMSLLPRLRNEGAVAPPLWRYEIANSLMSASRRNRIAPSLVADLLLDLDTLNVTLDEVSDVQAWQATLHLAQRHRLTVYDAAYLELAQRQRMPLATLDGDLARAARDEGVTVLP